MNLFSYLGTYYKPRKSQIIHRGYAIFLLLVVIFIILNLIMVQSQPMVISNAIADVDREILGSGPGRFNSIITEDIDDDGRFEIVYGNYEGYVTILEYRHNDFFEEWRSPDIGQRVWGITVADLLGDSTKEIIVGNGDAEIYIYNAKTHDKVWDSKNLDQELVRDVHGLLVHDLGMNGTPYLLAGTGYKTDNDLGTVFIFNINATTDKPQIVATIGQFENRMRGLGVGDVDSDGKLEIVVGSGVATGERPGEGYIRVYDVNSVLTEKDVQPEWKSPNLKGDCVALELADFTGDGVLDIVVGNGYRYQAGWVRILTYDSSTGDYIEYWKSPNNPDIGPKPYGLAVGDINGDNDLEIIVGNQAGYIFIYGKTGSVIDLEWRSKLLGSDILGIDIGDLDDDGQVEIVAAQGGYTGKGDYTSGYTDPHIYIIDGKSHKIEHIIGKSNILLDYILPIIALILTIIFLVALNLYSRFHKRLKEIQVVKSTQNETLTQASVTSIKSTIQSSPPKTLGTSRKISELNLDKMTDPTKTITQMSKIKPSPSSPSIKQPIPQTPSESSPPEVNDPFPKSEVK